MSKLRLGIVGVGKHGTRYAEHAKRDVEAIELAAVCRRDRSAGEDIARRLGCDFTPDAHALIARDDIDAVVLATVPLLLESLVETAARHGKALLVEKPVAVDLASGSRILRTIESSGIYCTAGHTLRFNRVVNRMRELAPSLGRIDTLVLTQRFPPQLALAWLDDPAQSGGGNVLHTGVHGFDLVRYLTGLEPAAASCTIRNVYTRATEDNFVARIALSDSDALVLVACSRTTRGRNGWIEVAGEHGQLVGDHVLNTLYRLDDRGRTDIRLEPAAFTVLEALRDFAASVRSRVAPRASYRDGLIAVAVAAACYASARSGALEPVVLPSA